MFYSHILFRYKKSSSIRVVEMPAKWWTFRMCMRRELWLHQNRKIMIIIIIVVEYAHQALPLGIFWWWIIERNDSVRTYLSWASFGQRAKSMRTYAFGLPINSHREHHHHHPILPRSFSLSLLLSFFRSFALALLLLIIPTTVASLPVYSWITWPTHRPLTPHSGTGVLRRRHRHDNLHHQPTTRLLSARKTCWLRWLRRRVWDRETVWHHASAMVGGESEWIRHLLTATWYQDGIRLTRLMVANMRRVWHWEWRRAM